MSHLFLTAAIFARSWLVGGGGGLLVTLLMVFGLWAIFDKAREPGWAAIVPLYNFYVLFKIAGWSPLALLLLLIPGVNVVVLFLVYLSLAGRFGKGFFHALGMLFLPFLFFPVLGMGSATYSANR